MNNRANHYSRAQGGDMGHRGSAIRRRSVTEGCDRGEVTVENGGSRVPAKKEWMVAVTEQRDKTGRSVRRGRPNNRGNYR